MAAIEVEFTHAPMVHGMTPVDQILAGVYEDHNKEKFWGEAKWREGASFDGGSAQYWGECQVYGTAYDKIQVRHGSGLCVWSTGDIYLGQHDKDLREGKGVCIYRDGKMYDGDWKEGLRHGYGRCVYANGSMYLGRWENDERDGPGVYKWADGTIYMGSWQYDRRHGHGTVVFTNGNFYEGQIQSNMKHGWGRYVWSQGSCYYGDFCRDDIYGVGVYVHEGEQYNGHFVNPGKLKRPTLLELKDNDRESVISEELLRRAKTVMDKKISRQITRNMQARKLGAQSAMSFGSSFGKGMGDSLQSMMSTTPRKGEKRPPPFLPKLAINRDEIQHVRPIRSDSWFVEPSKRNKDNEAVCFRMVFDEDWLKVKDRSVKLQSSSQTLSRVSLPKGRTPSPHKYPVTLNRYDSLKSPSPFQMRCELVTTISPNSMEPTYRDMPHIFDGGDLGFPREGMSNVNVAELQSAIVGGTHMGDMARKALERARKVVREVTTFVIRSGLVSDMKDDSDPKYIAGVLKQAAVEKQEMMSKPRRGSTLVASAPAGDDM